MKDLLIKKFVTEFRQEFTSATVLVEKVYSGQSIIHSVFVEILDEEKLNNDWIRITNFIAIHYQSSLVSDFERWNLYLFFLLPDEIVVSDDLKYAIENNTFSSRKIIEVASLTAKSLIEKHINNFLTIEGDAENAEKTDFEHNPIIYSVLKNKKLKNKRILPKALEAAYDQLTTKLKRNL